MLGESDCGTCCQCYIIAFLESFTAVHVTPDLFLHATISCAVSSQNRNLEILNANYQKK